MIPANRGVPIEALLTSPVLHGKQEVFWESRNRRGGLISIPPTKRWAGGISFMVEFPRI